MTAPALLPPNPEVSGWWWLASDTPGKLFLPMKWVAERRVWIGGHGGAAPGVMAELGWRLHAPADPDAAETIRALREEVAAHREADKERRALVRRLDVALNGEDGAAKQAALCDVVGQVEDGRWRLVPGAELSAPRGETGGAGEVVEPEVGQTWGDGLTRITLEHVGARMVRFRPDGRMTVVAREDFDAMVRRTGARPVAS